MDSFFTIVLFNIDTIILFDGFSVFLGMDVVAYALGKGCLTGFCLITDRLFTRLAIADDVFFESYIVSPYSPSYCWDRSDESFVFYIERT